jgi:hypothetical protein
MFSALVIARNGRCHQHVFLSRHGATMNTQIWVKSQEKWAYILTLKDWDVSVLKITGNAFTLRGKVKSAVEALEQGKSPAEVGASSVQTLDARKIGRAVLGEGNTSLTLKGEGDNATELSFSPAEPNAGEIWKAVLERTGRKFHETTEEIGVVEAVLPPGFIGLFGGLLWFVVYSAASDIASGKEVEVKGGGRRGLQRLAITVAEMLGPNGVLVVGVLLLVLIVGWVAMRIIKRPTRTVWVPDQAAA